MLKRLVKDFEVYAAAPFIDAKTRSLVEDIGVQCISTEFDRTGLNPIKDVKAYFRFKRQLKSVKPDHVLAYTIKPVIFGLRATKFTNASRFALITGKGSGFDQSTFKNRIIRFFVKFLYRSTLRSVDGVIFQNDQDKVFFESEGILSKVSRSTVIKGTGVDLNHYLRTDKAQKGNKVVFLFIARLIREKGIPELLEATALLKKIYQGFEVQLLGWIDPNPGGISKKEIDDLHASGLINYLGTTDDIRPYMDAADVFVLPSYYNEGLPRTIQEAMAMGKPIITTDHPGCRETVEEGSNGFLVSINDADSLAKAMQYFMDSPSEIERMGEESYKMAIERFDVHKINEQLLDFMRLKNV
ncbi:glycosyltransferase family 4 protein [Roseivirga sp. 4D4]|uniref:glycosyltransferase family 4 protein n=1 Tax=Roseivirga sp. 4D4 TaxID=1889784 RepID=UPI000A883074|nr:glycosyltransferase family 4 protein [Roseivirga sp. 4D4]